MHLWVAALGDYANLFTPFWKSFDVALVIIGVWFAWQPSVLLEPYAAMALTRERVERLGLPAAVTNLLLSISRRREDLEYRTLPLRVIAGAFIAAGVLGFTTAIDQTILVSGLTVVSIGALAFVFLSARRKTSVRGALLGGSERHTVLWWFVGTLVAEAAAEASVGSRASLAAALALGLCAALIALLVSLPIVLSGADVALERQVDRGFRVARAGVCALLSQLPPLVWAASIEDARPPALIARIVVSAGFLCVVASLLWAGQRFDRDLRQAAADVAP